MIIRYPNVAYYNTPSTSNAIPMSSLKKRKLSGIYCSAYQDEAGMWLSANPEMGHKQLQIMM